MEHPTVGGEWERIRDAGGGALEPIGDGEGSPLERAAGLELERITAALEDSAAPNTLRGLRRQAERDAAAEHPRGRGQAEALRRGSVEAAAALAAADGTVRGLRDAALLRLGSDCFLRVSELACP